MKKPLIGFVLFAGALVSFTASAALPPYYSTAKEIIAILQSDEVAQKITSGRGIDGVIRHESSYIIQAHEYCLQVDVEYQLVDPTTTDSPFATRKMVLKVGELFSCYYAVQG